MTRTYAALSISPAEIAKARAWALRRSGPPGSLRTVAEAVGHYAEQDGNRLAVVDGDVRLTYGDLSRHANATAALLHRSGCDVGDVVAVCGPRSAQCLVAWLAIEQCQAVYLPLAPGWPERRLAGLLASSGAKFFLSLSDRPGDDDFAEAAARSAGIRLLRPVREGEELAPRVPNPSRDRLCYLLYTSGSTGVPKGVHVEQGGMLNHLYAKVIDLGLSEEDSVALTAPLTFDISIWQMLAPLLAGGAVHVVRAADDPARLAAALRRSSTTVLELVPTVIELVLGELASHADDPPLPCLRWLLATGEELPPRLAARCLNDLAHVRLMSSLYANDETGADPARRSKFERYLDYRESRLRTAEMLRAGEYWKRELSGQLPVLDLPGDNRIGRSGRGYQGRTVERVLDGHVHSRLKGTCRATGCTPFMVALAGYALALGYYTAADEVIIGAPIANREDQERIDIPTFALNMLPLRIEMPPSRTLGGHLEHVRRKVTDAYAAADYPFAWMLRSMRHPRSGDRTPVFQTMLNALMYPAKEISVDGARWSFTELDTGYTKYDCALYLQRHGSDGVLLQFVYQPGLLSDDLAGALLESVLTAISAISAEPAETIGTVDLLTTSHRAALAEFGNEEYDRIKQR